MRLAFVALVAAVRLAAAWTPTGPTALAATRAHRTRPPAPSAAVPVTVMNVRVDVRGRSSASPGVVFGAAPSTPVVVGGSTRLRPLSSAATSSEEGEETPAEATAAEEEQADAAPAQGDDAPPEKEADPEKEDDPRVALQATIADLETQLRDKRYALVEAKDAADDVSKNGVYRLAAQVEMYKRNLNSAAGASTDRQRATVLKTFVPVIEGFEAAAREFDAAEGLDEAAKKLHLDFQETYKTFMAKFRNMGMEEYHAVVGTPFDEAVHEAIDVVGGKGDDDTTTMVVKSGLVPGLRLQDTGAILRPAKCIVERPAAAAEGDSKAAEAPDTATAAPEASEEEAAASESSEEKKAESSAAA